MIVFQYTTFVQLTKHHSKMIAKNMVFHLHNKSLTSLVINELLETNNKDTNILREMKKTRK